MISQIITVTPAYLGISLLHEFSAVLSFSACVLPTEVISYGQKRVGSQLLNVIIRSVCDFKLWREGRLNLELLRALLILTIFSLIGLLFGVLSSPSIGRLLLI